MLRREADRPVPFLEVLEAEDEEDDEEEDEGMTGAEAVATVDDEAPEDPSATLEYECRRPLDLEDFFD
jgi:hypothetical protein